MLDFLMEGFTLPSIKTTVLHDWMKCRHGEVDEINGLVVNEAQRLGIPAPVNSAIVEIAKRIESGVLKADAANLGLLQDLIEGQYPRMASSAD
jgi:2-dehydropantoate 2-reductase